MFLKYKLHIMLLIVILSIFPQFAFAADSLFGNIPATDKSMELLGKMFGKLGVFESGGTDAFAGVISTFNAAVLVIGGVLVAYTIFIGTIGTAHDGEMMGKKFSSAWVPIRTALGTAVVLPVIEGSYCIMQAIVGWLIVQGIGLANSVWASFVNPANMTSTIQVNMTSRTAEDTVWKIFSNLACVRTMESVHNELKNDSLLAQLLGFVEFGHKTYTSNNAIITNFGATVPAPGFAPSFCGTAKLTKSDLTGNVNLGTDLLNQADLKAKVQTATTAQQTNVTELITKLDAVAISFAANPDDTAGTISQVRTIAKEYSKKSLDNANTLIADLGSLDKLSESATKDGWVLAGAWYIRMSYLLDQAAKIASYHPAVNSPKTYEGAKIYQDKMFSKYATALNTINRESKNLTGVVEFDKATKDAGNNSGNSNSTDLDEIFEDAFRSDDNMYINKDNHPVMAMKNLGNSILNSVGISVGVIGTALAASAVFGAVVPLGQTLTSIITVVGMILFAPLVAVGFTLSYVLPMMPFMIWIGVVLGWVILCVEAIIAAPMWAVMHLSPHGDDMVGTGSQGYRLVLSLMLRPVLMIFGLIAALTIITVFGQLINEVFTSIFDMSQVGSNWFIKAVGWLASGFIYAGLMWTLITKTMSIVHVIPDQLLQWFGGGGSQLGDYGQTIGGHGSQTFAATAVAGSIAGQGLSAGKQIKDLNLQKEQARNSAAAVAGDKLERARDGVDKKFGAGSANLQSALMQHSGVGGKAGTAEGFSGFSSGGSEASLENQQKLSQVADTADALGGSVGADFKDNLTQALSNPDNKDKDFNQLFNQSLFETLSQNRGSGAASFVAGAQSQQERGERLAMVNSVFDSDSVSKRLPGSQAGGVGQHDQMDKIFGGANSKDDVVQNLSAMAPKAPTAEPKNLSPLERMQQDMNSMGGPGFRDNPGGSGGQSDKT